MSEPALSSLDRKTLADFQSVLAELTGLIAEENAILEIPTETLPLALIEKKEQLSGRYAQLTVALRRRVATLHAAGALDPVDLESRIRALVQSVKDNQILLNARKAATALRVEAVMQALAERERREAMSYGANGNTVPRERVSLGALHLQA